MNRFILTVTQRTPGNLLEHVFLPFPGRRSEYWLRQELLNFYIFFVIYESSEYFDSN